MASLERIEGIGSAFGTKLAAVSVRTTDKLLAVGGTPIGRKELAQISGIADALILTWVNKADLFRIKGIGEEYSDLLERAGVDTVPELAQRNSEHLHARIREVNEAKPLVRRLPSRVEVKRWVAQAKKLRRAIHY